MIGTTVSHYKILEQIGAGGMGVVYKAQDLRLDRAVALKFLPPGLTRDPDAKQRFIHEAKAASPLQHNNICTVHDIDESPDGDLFIVMDYYEGETLRKKIEQGPLQTSVALDTALQVAQGLSAAHHAGIVHRDLKPANILITRTGVAKILDFGLAKLTGRTLLTRTGSTLGTAAYMSPEQAGGGVVDQRTDIWAFGVMLYEMLTGQRPFAAEYENALMYAILNTEPKSITGIRAGIQPELEQIVTTCLAKNAADRYQDVDSLIADLRSCGTGAIQTRSASERPLAPAKSAKGRKPTWYALAALGAVALGLVGYILFFPHGEGTEQKSRPKMIAVLPFENLGAVEDEYFADGLSEEISARLGSIHGLGVISRQSTMQYRKSTKALSVVAEELGVDYVLAATIRWVKTEKGERVRITPHLVRVPGDVQLWAENMDATLDDVFRVQTDIAIQVVSALGVALREGERSALEAIPTKNLEAYQAYLRGIASGPDYERNTTRTAIEMFERAVRLDTTFSQAYVALATAHLRYYWEGSDRTTERLAATKQALDRAFVLQPDLPEASVVLSLYYYWGHRDYEKALEILKKVERRLPNDSRIQSTFAYIWRRQGMFEEALDKLKTAFRLDPRSFSLAREVGNTLYELGIYPEAERYLDRAISLLPDQSLTFIYKSNMYLRWHGDVRKSRRILEQVPTAYVPWRNFVELDIYERNYPAALDHLAKAPERVFVGQHEIASVCQLRGLICRFLGDTLQSRASFDTARVILKSEITKRPGDERLHASLGIVLAGLGRDEEAIEEAKRGTALMPISRDAISGAYPMIALAQVYTMVHKHDAALSTLEYLLSLHAPKLITPSLLRIDPTYDPLRSEQRFKALLSKDE